MGKYETAKADFLEQSGATTPEEISAMTAAFDKTMNAASARLEDAYIGFASAFIDEMIRLEERIVAMVTK